MSSVLNWAHSFYFKRDSLIVVVIYVYNTLEMLAQVWYTYDVP